LAHGALSSTISDRLDELQCGKLLRFLVALIPVPDLLLCAKDLFVEAMVAIVPAGAGQR